MDIGSWLTVLVFVMWLSAALIVVGVIATVIGKLNAMDDDEPKTIIARAPMNDDDGEW